MGKSDVSIECFDSVPDAPPRTIEFYLSEGSYDLKALWKICKKLYAGIVVPGLGIKTYTMMGGMSNISPWETGVALLAPVAGFAYLAWSVVDIGRFLYRHWSDMKSVTSGICVYTKWDSMQIESP